MLYPHDADRYAIRNLLGERGIPDAFATLSLSNRGDIAAQEVVVSLSVPGRVVAEETEPPPETKPAWVAVFKEFDAEKDPSRIRYILKNVGLARTYSIKVSYISEPLGDARWEVFFDGKPGILVDGLVFVPENARAVSFTPTLTILGFGLLLSAIAYALIRNREALRNLSIVRVWRMASASPTWRCYKNSLVFELCRSELVTLSSFTDGSINSLDPQDFGMPFLKRATLGLPLKYIPLGNIGPESSGILTTRRRTVCEFMRWRRHRNPSSHMSSSSTTRTCGR